jgi:5-oxoprolinase (ATP-hydrolysing)
VTDANLLLGRLQADFFPAVFGPHADQPLDIDASAPPSPHRPHAQRQLNLDYSPEQLAAGYLDIAVEHMADAIRHITLARGVNPADFTLVGFGGAGGQHACAVAARLGIRQVLISPFASVLSAYGIGLAERREIARRRWSSRSPPCPRLASRLREDTARCCAMPAPTACWRFRLGELDDMRAAFHAEHRARFGFADPARELICVALESETVSGGGRPQALLDLPTTPARAIAQRRYFLTVPGSTPVYQRDQLAIGQTLTARR